MTIKDDEESIKELITKALYTAYTQEEETKLQVEAIQCVRHSGLIGYANGFSKGNDSATKRLIEVIENEKWI